MLGLSSSPPRFSHNSVIDTRCHLRLSSLQHRLQLLSGLRVQFRFPGLRRIRVSYFLFCHLSLLNLLGPETAGQFTSFLIPYISCHSPEGNHTEPYGSSPGPYRIVDPQIEQGVQRPDRYQGSKNNDSQQQCGCRDNDQYLLHGISSIRVHRTPPFPSPDTVLGISQGGYRTVPNPPRSYQA